MRNILFFLKLVNKDFVLNYKTFNVFLNLGIFLCWGCLLASVITGIFEHKLENKISDKSNLQAINLSVSKLQDDLENTYSFFISIDKLASINVFPNHKRKLFYLDEVKHSVQRCINYLKLFDSSEKTKSKVNEIENKIKEFQETKSSFIKNNYQSFLSLGQQITWIKYETFEVLEDKKIEIKNLISSTEESIEDYNKMSSLTFILIFSIQLIIFIFIQSFEISLERRNKND